MRAVRPRVVWVCHQVFSGMIERIRQFLRTGAGRVAAMSGAALMVVVAAWSIWSTVSESNEAANLMTNRVYVCAETGKSFVHEIERRETLPVHSPHSGKKTGYPAELCYWTADGKAKKEPSAVLLNMTVGKSGQTFCPDCDRLVVPYNPYPVPGGKPPPTQQEYQSARAQRPEH